jgi:16S rRNA (uracil1498-N3)-methyltransferase
MVSGEEFDRSIARMRDNPRRMLPRFYAPSLDPAVPEVTLPADEAAHLVRVLRLAPGDAVAVFDGRGVEFRGQVARASRGAVTVALLERLVPATEPGVRLALTQAVLKPEAMDDVVRDATMMGVSRIDPVITSHVAVKGRVIAAGHASRRWQRIAIASAKQCRRATVPLISEPKPLADWLRAAADDWRVLLVEPQAMQGGESSVRDLLDRPRPSSAALLVGPEGGWSPDERRAATAAGCLPVSLGALTLRADAVPVAAIALLRFVLGDL